MGTCGCTSGPVAYTPQASTQQPTQQWTGVVTPEVHNQLLTVRQLISPNTAPITSTSDVTARFQQAAQVQQLIGQAYDGYFSIQPGSPESFSAIAAGAPRDAARGAEFQRLLRAYALPV